MCVYRGGGGVAGVSPPTRGSWPGVTRLPAYQGGGAAIHTYVILALATSHPDNMSLKIVVIS